MAENLGFEMYRNVEVEGALGRIVFSSIPMPIEVAERMWSRGESVPLDVVPTEFWQQPGSPIPRFGEEVLGDEF